MSCVSAVEICYDYNADLLTGNIVVDAVTPVGNVGLFISSLIDIKMAVIGSKLDFNAKIVLKQHTFAHCQIKMFN